MWEDPIVAEVHRTRDALAAAFNYDVKAVFADLYARQGELSDRLVSRVAPKTKPQKVAKPAKAKSSISNGSKNRPRKKTRVR